MQRTANPCTSVQFRYRPPKIHLTYRVFRLSSAVEQSAVNRLVACSNQAAGANPKALTCSVLFLCLKREQAYFAFAPYFDVEPFLVGSNESHISTIKKPPTRDGLFMVGTIGLAHKFAAQALTLFLSKKRRHTSVCLSLVVEPTFS